MNLLATRAESRFVYDFDEPCAAGGAPLGGKGEGLAEITALGVPVPAGFTITTDACLRPCRGLASCPRTPGRGRDDIGPARGEERLGVSGI